MGIEELKEKGEVIYLDSGNSDAIKAVQRYLNEHGYTDAYGNKLSEDGDYGKNTFNAVIKYQQANNLTADGKIGDETWNHMWSNYGGTGNTSEHNRYEVVKTKEKRNSTVGGFVSAAIDYSGATDNLKRSNIHSPDGYVEQVENENALREREEPITGVQDPYDMASYAQRHLDVLEQLYQKNRLSR